MSGGEPSSIKRFSLCDAGCLSVCISGCMAAAVRSVLFFLPGFQKGRGHSGGIWLEEKTEAGRKGKLVKGMYQVLYRKWRPKTFSEVVGQPQVTVTLQNELEAGRIAHAYLFTGSRGTGKTTCARILAKAVNCLRPKDGDPCGSCEICEGIDNGSVMDVVEIDAASNNGVDSIRTLREEAGFTPAAARYRVYIIDEVHMLSIGAFNALLKTLEEPPAHVIFILGTTEVHKIPATILSRCQRFNFRRIPPEEIAQQLSFVAEEEGAHLDEEAALLLARLADGAMRDAYSLLDQCLGREKEITVSVVTEATGMVGRDHLFSLAEAVERRDSAAALEQIDGLYSGSKDMARLCEELSSHYRSLMLIKTMRDARNMLAVSEEEYVRLTGQALRSPLPAILHALNLLQEALEHMSRGADRRIEMEMTLLKLCAPELDSSMDAVIRRIEALERGAPRAEQTVQTAQSKQTEPVPPAEAGSSDREPEQESTRSPEVSPGVSVPLHTPVEIPAAAPPEPTAGADQAPTARKAAPSRPASAAELMANARRLAEWPEILQILKEYSAAISAAFTGSSAYVSGDYVLIDAPREMAFELLRKSSQRDKMRDVIQQVTGKVYKLGPYKPASSPAAQEEADPLAELAGKAREAGIEVVEK